MNGVHLVTQEKKRVKNGSKMGRVHRVHCPRPAQAPRPRAPRAPSACLPRAQRPAAGPAPCRAPSALPPACAWAQLPLARERARQPAPVRLPPCAPQHALRATPAHARLPSAPGTPSTHARPAPTARSPPSHARLCRRYNDYIVAWLGTALQYSPALLLLHSCNTIFVLQYKSLYFQISLQYNLTIHFSLGCNTIFSCNILGQ